MQESKRLNPLNPPEGIVCIAIIYDIKNGTIDLQGHINNEEAATHLLEDAIVELKRWHKSKKSVDTIPDKV